MEKVLFEEVPAEDRAYRKWALFGVIASFFASAFMMAFAVLIAVVLWNAPIAGLVIGGMFFLLAAMPIYSAISTLYSRRQYIRIYADRIVYRQRFQKAEQVIHLRPQDYKIKLHYAIDVWGSYPQKFEIQLIFLDANGKKLFSYKAPTLNRSFYQSPRHKWEDDLLLLGCEIIDYENIIANK